MSKTQEALALWDANPGMSPYEVARKIGIATPTLYKAIKARRLKEQQKRCPTCGQRLNS